MILLSREVTVKEEYALTGDRTEFEELQSKCISREYISGCGHITEFNEYIKNDGNSYLSIIYTK